MRHKPNRRTVIKITKANTVGKIDAFSPKECAGVLQQILWCCDPRTQWGTVLSPTASYQQGSGRQKLVPLLLLWCTGSFIWAFLRQWSFSVLYSWDLKKFKNDFGMSLRVKTRNIHQITALQEEEGQPQFLISELIFLRKWWARESLAGYSPWAQKESDMTEHAIND